MLLRRWASVEDVEPASHWMTHMKHPVNAGVMLASVKDDGPTSHKHWSANMTY